jgi:hypothetical protein
MGRPTRPAFVNPTTGTEYRKEAPDYSGLPSDPCDNCIRRWPEETDPRPQPCWSSCSALRRSRRPLPLPWRARARAGSDRLARGRRLARILRRRAIARRELGAGGAAARRSTICASGPPRRGASHARSSPAIRPPAPAPAPRTPARSDAVMPPLRPPCSSGLFPIF